MKRGWLAALLALLALLGCKKSKTAPKATDQPSVAPLPSLDLPPRAKKCPGDLEPVLRKAWALGDPDKIERASCASARMHKPVWAVLAVVRLPSQLVSRVSLIDPDSAANLSSSDIALSERGAPPADDVLLPADFNADQRDEVVIVGHHHASDPAVRLVRVWRTFADSYDPTGLSVVFDAELPPPAPGCTFAVVHEALGDALRVPRLEGGACVEELVRWKDGKLVK